MAWEFKPNKPKRIRSGIGSFWYGTKKAFGLAGKPLDANADTHRNAFKDLVRQIKDAIRPDNYILTLTVLPNQNTTVHYDIQSLVPNLDFITLAAYDYQTWDRNPNEADYPAPIYGLHDRIPESNIDFQVNLWLQGGAPAHKLIIAIPTHGRSWQLTPDSTRTGVPPILEVSFVFLSLACTKESIWFTITSKFFFIWIWQCLGWKSRPSWYSNWNSRLFELSRSMRILAKSKQFPFERRTPTIAHSTWSNQPIWNIRLSFAWRKWQLWIVGRLRR